MNKYIKIILETIIICVFISVPVFADDITTGSEPEGSNGTPAVEVVLTNKTSDRTRNEFGELKSMSDDIIQMDSVIMLQQNNLHKIIVTIPQETDYIDNSFNVKDLSDNTFEKQYYKIRHYDNAAVYTDNRNQSVILLTDNKFYDLDDNLLSDKSYEDAVYSYNNKYGTYIRNDELTVHTGVHIFKLDFSGTFSEAGIKLNCSTQKNILGSRSGRCDYSVECLYSDSDTSNPSMTVVRGNAGLFYDGIVFSSCEGNGITNINDWNYVLNNARRINNTTIDVYKYDASIPSAEADNIQQIKDSYGDNKYYMISAGDQKKFYHYIGSVTTQENGEAAIGGITVDDYLITEPDPPQEYSFFSSFQLVSKDLWNRVSAADSSQIIDVVVINYKDVILPGSGLGYRHEWKYWVIGSVILIGVIIVRIWFAYKKRNKEKRNYSS